MTKRALYYFMFIVWIVVMLYMAGNIAHAQTYIKGPGLIEGVTNTATAGGTTVLTKDSQTNQRFTGTLTQTVQLPDATTIPIGRRFYITNRSTGNLTIIRGGGGVQSTLYPTNSAEVRLMIAGSADGTWTTANEFSLVNIAEGGTGQANTATAGGAAYGTATAISLTAAGTAGQFLRSNAASPPTWSAVSVSADITGVLALVNGGTNAANIANAGGVAFSTASAISLGPVGLAGQHLTSNAAASPTWTTATFPSTATAPCSLLANTNNAITCLAATTGNRVLRTDGSTLAFSQVVLTTDVTGVLPLANGGTNSTLVSAQLGAMIFSTATALSVGPANTVAGRAVVSGALISGTPLFYAPTAGSVIFAGTSGAISEQNDAFFFDATNRGISVGISAASTSVVISGVTMTAYVQTQNNDQITQSSDFMMRRYRNTGAASPILRGLRARGTSAAPVIVNNADDVFRFTGLGYDGVDYEEVGDIRFEVDGTPGSNDMPGRIVFRTTPDGSTVMAEAMRISQDLVVKFTGAIDTALTTSGPVFSGTTGILSSQPVVGLTQGGTGQANTATTGGVAYGTASAISITAVGVSGQYFRSDAAVAAPAWSFPKIVTKSATYTAATSDETITFSADATLNLPAAAGANAGKVYNITSTSATAEVTIDPNSTETVCGQTTVRLEGNDSMVIQSDGTNWIGLNNSCIKQMFSYLTNTGSCAVSTQTGTWITSVSDPGAGQCGVVWSSATWSAIPWCQCTANAAGGANICAPLNVTTSTGVTFLTQSPSGGGTSTDSPIWLHCSGPR